MVVLDASALLALILKEPGQERVAGAIASSSMSAVNLGEVLTRLQRNQVDIVDTAARLQRMPIQFVAFDAHEALAASLLWPLTRGRGLSFGDRACLALARRLRAPVLTGDRAWTELDLGVEIELIR
jgi:PIN domain nuclease of toxin-antitoxin system